MFLKINKIIKKELHRFFGDRRLVISALVLPGLLLYFVYAFLAPIMIGFFIGDGQKSIVYSINTSDVVQTFFGYAGIELVNIPESDNDNILEGIIKKDGNFLLYFPHGFDSDVLAYNINSGENAPEILFYYNSLSDGFLDSFSRITTILSAYEKSISKKFDINLSGGGDLASSSDSSNNFLISILPMFILVFIYHGAVATTTGSITGEKEHGSLVSVLITPITSLELATGKIVSLGIESLLCGISGTVGILLSIPRFLSNINSKFDSLGNASSFLSLSNISLFRYNIADYCFLLMVLLSCSFFVVTLISIISLYSKTVKEAQMTLSPMILIIMLLSMLSSISNISQNDIYLYLIPIINSVQCMNNIFNRSYLPLQLFLSTTSNISFSFFGTLLLSKMYQSERIINPA